jgi:biotin carboxyl carrier protein
MKKIENKKKPGELIANMPGLIRDIRVKKGDTVNENQTLLIVEAMKMENILTSECDGVIEEIFINIGDTVSTGDKLIKIKPNA